MCRYEKNWKRVIVGFCNSCNEVGKTRMDLLSYQYYDNPNFGWLILQANPSVGSLEYKIKDGTRLRIPYPLETALQGYENNLAKYVKLYGLN